MNGRVLVCVSSLLRHFEHTLPSIRRHLLDRIELPLDVAGHFPQSERGQGAEQLGEHAGDCRLRYEADPEFAPELLAMQEGLGADQPRGILGNLLQWNSLLQCARLKAEMETKHGQYDWVVWLRPDVYFLSPIESLGNLPRGGLYFPIHDGFWGLNDRFCFGDSTAMDRRMRIFEYFTEHWYSGRHECRHVRRKPDGTLFWNPEIVLRSLVDDGELAPLRTQTVFGLLRKLGDVGNDPAGAGYFVSQPQVWDADIPQPAEFRDTCRKVLQIPPVRVAGERVPLLDLGACRTVFGQ